MPVKEPGPDETLIVFISEKSIFNESSAFVILLNKVIEWFNPVSKSDLYISSFLLPTETPQMLLVVSIHNI